MFALDQRCVSVICRAVKRQELRSQSCATARITINQRPAPSFGGVTAAWHLYLWLADSNASENIALHGSLHERKLQVRWLSFSFQMRHWHGNLFPVHKNWHSYNISVPDLFISQFRFHSNLISLDKKLSHFTSQKWRNTRTCDVNNRAPSLSGPTEE